MTKGEKNHLTTIKRIFNDAFRIDTDKLELKDIHRITIERNYMGDIVIVMPLDLALELHSPDRLRIPRRNLRVPLYSNMNDTYLIASDTTVESIYEFVNNQS